MLSPAKLVAFYKFSLKSSFCSLQQTRSHNLLKMSSEPKWKVEKNRILSLPIEEKRKLYKCSSDEYIVLERIEPWSRYSAKNPSIQMKSTTSEDVAEFKKMSRNTSLDKQLAEKVAIYKGDITKLEIDAIVNAANSRLMAGGGVDGAIHRAAGPLLQQECKSIGGCPTGEARITGGYDLPAKYVIHTVGPQDKDQKKLRSCYEKCLAFHQEYKFKSIAFPCISTGIYGFPNRLAAHTALKIAREFLEVNHETMDRIIFCTFMPVDIDIYETLMQMYFPMQEST